MGSAEKLIPFFNLEQDTDSCHDFWTDEGQAGLQDLSNGNPLALCWHQLVGALKMVENTFLKKLILLMDSIGLGKTIQVAAFVAVLMWYHEFCYAQQISRKVVSFLSEGERSEIKSTFGNRLCVKSMPHFCQACLCDQKLLEHCHWSLNSTG